MKQLVFISTLLLSFIISSCKKDKDTIPPEKPICTITHPMSGEVFAQGNTLTIAVDVSVVNSLVEKVVFSINEVEVGSDFSFPYEFDWNSDGFDPGIHKLSASCVTDQGESDSDEIEVTLIEVELFTDPRDGHTYETVAIGNQIWFAENLSFDALNSNYYDDSPLIGEQYGRLYTWEEAQSSCPSGWHLPSDEEWMELEVFLGMDEDHLDSIDWRGTNQGSMLKCGYGWHTGDTSSNSSYFSGLPGGFFDPLSMNYLEGGNNGFWWTATSSTASKAYYRRLMANHYQVYRNSLSKDHKFSVRCVKDL